MGQRVRTDPRHNVSQVGEPWVVHGSFAAHMVSVRRVSGPRWFERTCPLRDVEIALVARPAKLNIGGVLGSVQRIVEVVAADLATVGQFGGELDQLALPVVLRWQTVSTLVGADEGDAIEPARRVGKLIVFEHELREKPRIMGPLRFAAAAGHVEAV